MQAAPLPPIHVTVTLPEHPWYAQWDFWVSVGTLLVAMLTGWYAYETRRLRKGSDKAMGELSKHAEKAAAASKDSAQAANTSAAALRAQVELTSKALEIAERSATAADRSAKAAEQSADLARQSHRAWITLNRIESSPDLANLVFLVLSTFSNTGQTPATDLQIGQHMIAISGGWQDVPLYPPFDANSSKAPLGAGEVCQVPTSIQLSLMEFTNVLSGKAILYAYGIAKYKDVYGVPHDTRWCLEFVPATKEFTQSSRFNSMS